jgi:hypothetical protein
LPIVVIILGLGIWLRMHGAAQPYGHPTPLVITPHAAVKFSGAMTLSGGMKGSATFTVPAPTDNPPQTCLQWAAQSQPNLAIPVPTTENATPTGDALESATVTITGFHGPGTYSVSRFAFTGVLVGPISWNQSAGSGYTATATINAAGSGTASFTNLPADDPGYRGAPQLDVQLSWTCTTVTTP